jgi:hypothetical protein
MEVKEQKYVLNKTIIVGDIPDPLYSNALQNNYIEFAREECRDPIIAEMLDTFYLLDHTAVHALTWGDAATKISNDFWSLHRTNRVYTHGNIPDAPRVVFHSHTHRPNTSAIVESGIPSVDVRNTPHSVSQPERPRLPASTSLSGAAAPAPREAASKPGSRPRLSSATVPASRQAASKPASRTRLSGAEVAGPQEAAFQPASTRLSGATDYDFTDIAIADLVKRRDEINESLEGKKKFKQTKQSQILENKKNFRVEVENVRALKEKLRVAEKKMQDAEDSAMQLERELEEDSKEIDTDEKTAQNIQKEIDNTKRKCQDVENEVANGVYGALPEKLRDMSKNDFLCLVTVLAAKQQKGGKEKEG